MSTWSSVLAKSAALMNDQDRGTYKDEVLLAYLNMALSELEEIFELHNIPVTNAVSATINVPAGETRIGFRDTLAQLPYDLIEIQQLWESDEGQNTWTPVTKRDFITAEIIPNNSPVTKFGVWAWINQQIHLLESLQNNDIKIDYIRDLFAEIKFAMLDQVISVLNCETFLQYRVAALTSEFIEENFIRSGALNNYASGALDRSLGISIKSQQSIPTRRRPFRAAYKRRRTWT